MQVRQGSPMSLPPKPSEADVANAKKALGPLLNPEPHPFQEDWSDAHSMTTESLITSIAQAIADQRERDCAEVCNGCRLKWALIDGVHQNQVLDEKDKKGHYKYNPAKMNCSATAIRKANQQNGGGE